MFLINKFRKMDTAGEGGEGGAAGGQEGKPAKQEENKGPNDNWKDDKSLDENGNPIEGKPPAKQENKEPEKEEKKEPEKEAKKEPEKKPEESAKVDFSAPVVDQIKTLVTDAGLDATEVVKAVSANDGKVTPAMMKALTEKHGDAVASLVASNLENFHVAAKEAGTKQDNAIYGQVSEAFKGVTEQSGKETWNELAGWAKENVPAAERQEINKALKQGGKVAEWAVNDLITKFKNHSPETQDAVLVTGDGKGNATGFQPLSKTEYTQQLRALEAKGHVYGESQEMKRLDERRTRSIQRGI